MASVVDIYNLALGRIGTDKTVSSVGENSKEARLCNRFYEQCRDEVLEAGGWPFAVKSQALASLPATNILGGWGYEYEKPADALRILEVTSVGGVGEAIGYWCGCRGPWDAHSRGTNSYRQALAQDGNSSVILSQTSGAYAIYVARIENPAVFSALMRSCIADRLAMELAMPMSADPRYLQMAMTRYNNSFMIAAGTDYEQTEEGPVMDAPSIRARA